MFIIINIICVVLYVFSKVLNANAETLTCIVMIFLSLEHQKNKNKKEKKNMTNSKIVRLQWCPVNIARVNQKRQEL